MGIFAKNSCHLKTKFIKSRFNKGAIVKRILSLLLSGALFVEALPNPDPSRNGDSLPVILDAGGQSYAYYYMLGTVFALPPGQPFQFTNAFQSGGYTLLADKATFNVPQSGIYLVSISVQAAIATPFNTISVGIVDTSSSSLLLPTAVSSFLGTDVSVGHILSRTSIVNLMSATNYQLQNTSANSMIIDQGTLTPLASLALMYLGN